MAVLIVRYECVMIEAFRFWFTIRSHDDISLGCDYGCFVKRHLGCNTLPELRCAVRCLGVFNNPVHMLQERPRIVEAKLIDRLCHENIYVVAVIGIATQFFLWIDEGEF